MKTYMQLSADGTKGHYKFEAESKPEWHPSIILVDITGMEPEPNEGDVWDGTAFFSPDSLKTTAELIAEKLSALAAYRYTKETGGIIVSGATIKTDRESQALIAGAKLYSDLNEAVLIDWKAENSWAQINRTAIMAISQAVAAHVQACFSQERVHAEAINALTTAAEIEAYDITTGWPATM